MHFSKIQGIFLPVFILIVLFCGITPAYADNGIVSITFRGDAGYNIGDTISFDGWNTAGNVTVIKITGPGLPAEGLPPYNLTDVAGTGNTVETDASGRWAFYWDTTRAIGIDNLYNARYTITASDRDHPGINASTIISLQKSQFYVTMTPNPAIRNNYVQLAGVAQKGVNSIEIMVKDSQGNKMHTFTSPVTSSGYFNYGFHVDMPPGQYTVTISSPSLSNHLTKTLTVYATNVNTTSPPVVNTTPGAIFVANETNVSVTSPETPAISGTTVVPDAGVLIVSSKPTGATVYLDSVMVGTTPLTLTSVSYGAHTVDIKLPGYLTCSINVVVSENKPTEIAPEMVSAPGLPLSPMIAIVSCIAAVVLFIVSGKKKK
ncbi:MAG: PEGA domain-containing protein [Methanoregula sp.]